VKAQKPYGSFAAEQVVMERITALRAEGEGFDATASILNREGHRPRPRCPMIWSAVNKICPGKPVNYLMACQVDECRLATAVCGIVDSGDLTANSRRLSDVSGGLGGRQILGAEQGARGIGNEDHRSLNLSGFRVVASSLEDSWTRNWGLPLNRRILCFVGAGRYMNWEKHSLFRGLNDMSTCKGHLPSRPDAVSGSVPEQDLNTIVIAMVYQYSALLNRVARSVTRDVSEAEDVVQETFLRVLRHHNKLAELQDARTWLIRITWNLALDRRRRAKTRRQTDDFEEVARLLTTGALSAETALIAAQRHGRILRLIDTLPAREREVLLLSAVKELSSVEIALVLKTTDSAVRSRLYRARKALQDLIGAGSKLDASECFGQVEA
jgi:RNA polymerase sigma-70 factor (ECF subfamily)